MSRRSRSSGRWLREHARDPYVRRARAQGARSRATFKLEEIDRVEHLLAPGRTVVDLGAAPGGWSQYAAGRLGARGLVVALDLLPMAAVPGVTFLQGDFRDPATVARLEELLGGRPVELVMSDLAPNMTGVDVVDQARAAELGELTLDFAGRVLAPGGVLLMKVFQGAGFAALLAAARRRFATVRIRKPAASRQRSAETYLVAGRRAE
ncbi:MAG: RlmE family RNA methyltransferase [Gammaproteobacteria bacterium]|nr:RlmE family RNA methyltransferase [Gammaproteobacteria bacterium]